MYAFVCVACGPEYEMKTIGDALMHEINVHNDIPQTYQLHELRH